MTPANLIAYRKLRRMGFKPARAWKLAHHRAIAATLATIGA